MDSLGEDCHLSQGELAFFRPQYTEFLRKEEKIVISAKVLWHTVLQTTLDKVLKEEEE